MEISLIYSYLVNPSKHEKEQPIIGGVKIPLSGKLFKMLNEIFIKADTECSIPICFIPEKNEQKNICLGEIIEFINNKNIEAGRKLAERLQTVTTSKSGLGLLFLILSKNKNSYKFLISRFPADQGVIAEQDTKNLKVEFIEKVFLKSSNAYKAVLYKGQNVETDFWVGNAIDKQINYGNRDIARYWIYDFLLSDFRTTPKAGTKRLATAIKNAVEECADANIKAQLSAAALLASTSQGSISIKSFCDDYNLSEDTIKILTSKISEQLISDIFEFDQEEFSRHISFKSLKLDNGAILSAPLDQFESCFTKEEVTNQTGEYKFTTQGKIIDEKLKKLK